MRRSSSILITEVYDSSGRRISVVDENTGIHETYIFPTDRPPLAGEADIVKQKLIEKVKERVHAGDRRSKAGVSGVASAPADTALAA